MYAVIKTGGKQYRVAPGDKIVVEKLDGNAGDSITISDVLLAGDGSDLKGTEGLTVAAEIVPPSVSTQYSVRPSGEMAGPLVMRIPVRRVRRSSPPL